MSIFNVQGTDQSYLQKLHHELSRHANFVKGADKRMWSVEFGEEYFLSTQAYSLILSTLLQSTTTNCYSLTRCSSLCGASGIPDREVFDEEQRRPARHVL